MTNPSHSFVPWTPPFTYDSLGSWIVDSRGNRILDVRGWGLLTGKGEGALGMDIEEAADIQDKVAEHIADLMNRDAVDKPTGDEALLQQALEALEQINLCQCEPDVNFTCDYCQHRASTITALQARLGKGGV